MKNYFCLFAFFAFLAVSFGQEKTPVTVTIIPKTSVPGASITFKGTSGIDIENATKMKIIVNTPVTKRDLTLTPPISKDGNFEALFKDTNETGIYTVKAMSPGGSGQATDTFTILAPAPAIEEYDKELKQLFPVADKGIERVTKILDELPDSEDKQAVEKKLDSLKEKMSQIKQEANISTVLQPLQQQIKKVPEEGALAAPLFGALSEWNRQAEEDRVRVNEELIKSAEKGEDCEKIDQAIEAVNLVSFLLNLISAPFGMVDGFVTDMIASKLSSWGASDAGGVGFKTALNLVAVENQKIEILTGPARWSHGETKWGERVPELDFYQTNSQWTEGSKRVITPAQLENTGLGLAFDLSNLFAKGYYGKRCERLEGPLVGEMDGQIAKNGDVYWKFKIGLKGKMILRHAKADPGTAIRVHGQLMGFGTNFSVEENMVRVLFPDVLKKTRAMTFHRVTTPAVNIALDAWNSMLSTQGAAAQTLFSPTSFYIPVEGDLIKDKLTLRLQSARFDFNEEKTAAHAIYVLISPIALAPYVINQPLPYRNADFIITHAMNAEDNRQAELKLTVDSAHKMTIISGDFKRNFENKEAEAEAVYTLTLKACTPACP